MSKIQEASNATTTLLLHYQNNNNVITKKNSRPFPNTSSSVSFVGSIKSTQGKPSLFTRFQNLSKGWKIFWGSLGLLITGILPGILIGAWICAAHKLSKPAPQQMAEKQKEQQNGEFLKFQNLNGSLNDPFGYSTCMSNPFYVYGVQDKKTTHPENKTLSNDPYGYNRYNKSNPFYGCSNPSFY